MSVPNEMLDKWESMPLVQWPRYSAQDFDSFVMVLDINKSAESPEELIDLCERNDLCIDDCKIIVCDRPMQAEEIILDDLLPDSFRGNPYDFLPSGFESIVNGLNHMLGNTVFGMVHSGSRLWVSNGFIATAEGWIGRNDDGEIVTVSKLPERGDL